MKYVNLGVKKNDKIQFSCNNFKDNIDASSYQNADN